MHKTLALSQGRKSIWIGLVGNVLDHYDTALYGFLAPCIAPLIFPESSPLVAIIRTYGLMSVSIITRPLGVLFFGNLGARYGAKTALSHSLTGLAVVTCGMGLLPTYAWAGNLAPCMLALLRILQGFFAAGETTVAPFFVLDHEEPKKRGFTDSIYGSSTVLGGLLASIAALFVSTSNNPDIWWRLPFFMSSLTAWVGLYLRSRVAEIYEPKLIDIKPINFIAKIVQHRGNFLRVIAVSGMSYITYSIPFIFFNSFIPQVTNISYAQMMTLNTSLLAFDMVLAPLFGLLSDKMSHARLMSLMALLLALSIMPLFYLLSGAQIFFVSGVRIFIVLIGLGFCAPLHAWFMTQFAGPERYVLTGLGYSIGSEIFGRSAPAICLFLWSSTQSTLGPALYIALIGTLAFVSVVQKKPSDSCVGVAITSS